MKDFVMSLSTKQDFTEPEAWYKSIPALLGVPASGTLAQRGAELAGNMKSYLFESASFLNRTTR